jgi:hypothetical protein
MRTRWRSATSWSWRSRSGPLAALWLTQVRCATECFGLCQRAQARPLRAGGRFDTSAAETIAARAAGARVVAAIPPYANAIASEPVAAKLGLTKVEPRDSGGHP